MSIFELPHIFVVFHPGASGNFIASLLEKLINNDTDIINTNSSGAAHTLISRKIQGTDYLSFGTEVDEHSNFQIESERIEFYLNKIKTEYNEVTTPQVVWSHDFTNIPLYKQFFPNAKILTITQESETEKVAVVLLHVIKNILDPNTVNPVTEKRMAEILMLWNFAVKSELTRLLGKEKAELVNADSTSYRYVSFMKMLSYYQVNISDDLSVSKFDCINTVLYPNKQLMMQGKAPYTIGKTYSEYTTDCIKLPFKYLIDNDVELLTTTLSNIVPIDDDKKKIIMTNYEKYRNSQNQQIISDPIRYYITLKQEALYE